MKNEIKKLEHSSYRCQYHIVFAPKYRRKVIYGELKAHIHMLVSIPPYLSISQFMGYIKSKSALMIFDRHANLKYKYGNRHFWATGYFVDTVGKNEKIIKEYIRNQLQEDYIADQIGIEEYIDPFKKEK